MKLNIQRIIKKQVKKRHISLMTIIIIANILLIVLMKIIIIILIRDFSRKKRWFDILLFTIEKILNLIKLKV